MAEEDPDPLDPDGMSQKRGMGDTANDRFRVTWETCQVIYKYFDEEQQPVGEIGPSMLVTLGAHGRLSNIDDNHNFIQTETFEYQGKTRVHQAESSAGVS